MRSTLRYSLFRIKKSVLFIIHYQDDRVTEQGPFTYRSKKTGMYVESAEFPQLSADTIFLRGWDKGNDDVIAVLNFDSVSKAKRYIKKADETLKDWVVNWAPLRECSEKMDSDIDILIKDI